MKKTDFLFIHVPSGLRRDLDIWFIPLGTIALADYLKKNKISCEIINLRIERLSDPSFDIIDYLKKSKTRIIGFDIQWYYQLRAVLKTIKKIKENIPEIKTIIGSMSASFFAKEILEKFPSVDFAIKGEAEIPLLKLIKVLKQGGGLNNIPNLVFRNEKIIQNMQSYTTSQKTFDNLCFSNLKLIKNHKTYLRYIRRYTNSELGGEWGYVYYYYIGKGCSFDCSLCGASNTAQLLINKRRKVVLKSCQSVVNDFKALKDRYGINTILLFNFPKSNTYFMGLFKKIKDSKLDMNIIFCVAWGSFISKGLIDALKSTFNKSLVFLDVFSVSEKIKNLSAIPHYSNKKLLEILDYLNKKNISTGVNFNTGLPFETKEDFSATCSFIKTLKSKYKNVGITAGDIQIVPASPVYLNNKEYKIENERKNLMDFYNISDTHKIADVSYATNNFNKEEILDNIKKLRTIAAA